MGDCKDQTKLSTPAPAPAAVIPAKDDKSALGIFSRGRKKADDSARVTELEQQVQELTKQLEEAKKPEALAQTFAQHVESAGAALEKLIESKEQDCKTEKNQEQYNERALGVLKTMRLYVHGIEESCNYYQDLRKN